MRRVLTAAAAIALLAGCSESPQIEPPADPPASGAAEPDVEPADEPEPEPEEVEEVADVGTRDNPAAVGSTATLGDWEVKVRKSNLDATDLVLEENMFNDEPEDGHVFVMAPVELAYSGDEPGTPWISVSFAVVGGDGNTYSESCGVTPKPIMDIADMYAGATAEANVCVSVKEDALDGAAWRIEESFSLSGSPAFFALTK